MTQQFSPADQLALATHQAQRLKRLLSRYKEAYAIQGALLRLSELASHISDMNDFYPAIHHIVSEYLLAENFYIVLYNEQSQEYRVQYFSDEKDQKLLASIQSHAFSSGLTGYVAKYKQPLLCDEALFQELVKKGEIEAQGSPSAHWMGIPLWRGEALIGVMAIQSYDNQRRYKSSDLKVFSSIGAHTVTALDRVRGRELLESTVKDRTEQLMQTNAFLQKEIKEREHGEILQAALYTISELTAISQDMATFYQEIHKVLCSLMAAENCYIALLDAEHNKLRFPFYVDKFKPSALDRPLGRGFTEYVIRSGEAKLINTELADKLVAAGEIQRGVNSANLATPLSHSWLGAPLKIEQRVIGVITVQSYDAGYHYSEQELSILRFVSQHIAVAIQRKLAAEKQKQHQEELERKVFESTRELRQTNLFLRLQVEERKKAEQKLFYDANHDALTGLANRQMFLHQLTQQLILSKRYPQTGMALLFLDLDRFKLINDTLGHHTGDAFLIECAKRLKMAVREHDLPARFGGDEFVVMLLNLHSPQDAKDVAQRIIDKFRQPYLVHAQSISSGVSIGIAPFQTEYMQADSMLRDADAAMYHAKAQGRDCYVVFQPEMRENMLQALQK